MITIIAAIGNNNELGKGNDLIWHLPADLQRFKKRTTGHAIIMGRNTFESIGKPLPNRRSIIITRNTSYQKEGCEIVHSLEDAIKLIEPQDDAFIIGGAQIYKEAMEKNVVDQLDITKVHQDFDADVFFPTIDSKTWKEVSREDLSPDEKNLYTYSFINYKSAT
jgi:dihydrofolate reductase